jgi:cytochrome b
MKVTIPVWDLPHRLFHWLLAISVAAAYITAKIGGEWIDWHGRLGIFILGLLIFRIIWGFVGSTHSRFVSFFPTLPRIITFIKGQWQGLGHNPLGAISAIALLIAVGVQVGTGLFANDDIAFEGPLFNFIDKPFSDKLTSWHNTTFNILLALIVLHVVAIFYYRWIKKTNLVVPMLTGKKEIPVTLAESIITSHGNGTTRFILSIIISGTVVWGISSGITRLYSPQNTQQTSKTAPTTQANANF